MHAPVTSHFVTTDPEIAAAAASAAYTDLRLSVSGSTENFRWEHQRHDLGQLSFDAHSTTLRTHYRTDPINCLQLVRVTGGQVESRSGTTASLSGPGDVMVMNPERDNDLRCAAIHCELVRVHTSLLDQLDPDWAADAKWEPTHRLSDPAASAWLRSVAYARRTVLFMDEAAASPLILGAIGRLLAATTLAAYRGEPAARPSDRADATPDSVRRAVAYIETNPDLDIGVNDIARHALVSVRSLQLGFRRHLGVTPMAYLRRVRLDLVHADLSAATPGDGATVTDIATRWGFRSLSQFAADFRAAYGEYPYEALRRVGI